jgi:hypothetical protein
MRAVVFVAENTLNRTERSPHADVAPLLVLTGEASAHMTFDTLYTQICHALRGDTPRLVATSLAPSGRIRMFFEDGTAKDVDL